MTQGKDAVLFRMLAEHRRLWQLGTEFRDNEEGEAYDAASKCLRDQIRVTQPTTLAGAIAQLELAVEFDAADMVKATIAGLREIAATEPQS